jgi:propionyl-CoA carboxylase alpha chain
VRVDTGVYEGGEIPMYYDSMIAKLIVHGRDRAEAIAKMRAALDAFVIRGIASNIPFQAALLAHPKFVAGDFDTGFIAAQWPKGFGGATPEPALVDFIVALAAAIKRRSLERASGLSGQLRSYEMPIRNDFVVVVHGEAGARSAHAAALRVDGATTHVSVGGRSHALVLASGLKDIATHGTLDGQPFCAQVERVGLDYRIAHRGSTLNVRVMAPRAAELYELMPHKAPPDLSRFLLSPMPGLLVDVAVQPGQKVLAGEKLAVIEAMKMENILLATQDGVVAKVVAGKGESLAVDQVILEFE